MFAFPRRRSIRKVIRRDKRHRPVLEPLETRTLLCTNYALNPAGTGFPSPLESDAGWGGGSYPWDMLDGHRNYRDTWQHGLAFTGGRARYPDGVTPAGLRQVTVDFGTSRTFQQVVVWHHGDEHVPATNDPNTTRLQYSLDGSTWRDLTYTRSFDVDYTYTGAGSKPDYYTFATVTGNKVRFTLDNRLNNIAGRQNEHGWIYEIEVNSAPVRHRVVRNTNDSGPSSLRDALTAANTSPGCDVVMFDIEGEGVKTINLASQLPNITDPLVIDSYTQPGARPNTLSVGGTANLLIELNGAGAGPASDGLRLLAGNSSVRGLVINRFTNNAILVTANGGNQIEGNFLGTDPSGTQGRGNARGIAVESNNNSIGGLTPAARNLISGNRLEGVKLYSNSSNNRVQGNYIGTNAAGTAALGNGSHGVYLLNSPRNTIGGIDHDPGVCNRACNLISGNGEDGVLVADNGSTENQVQGNFIGMDATGAFPLRNVGNGVSIYQGPSSTLIGGTAAGAGNVIAGNSRNGIFIFGASTTGNHVQGNLIGVGATGTLYVLSHAQGVYIVNAPNNLIGGDSAGARNVISSSYCSGVWIDGAGATNNRVQGNYIGTDRHGTARLGNSCSGVTVLNARDNIIGGDLVGTGNLISGNADNGVRIEGAAASGNRVQGNYIGTNAAGTARLPEQNGGVYIVNAPNNTVGGTTHDAGLCNRACNVISGNNFDAVRIEGAAASGNVVQGNHLGTNAAGTEALPNERDGVRVENAPNNTIGGSTVVARNLISGNYGTGVWIEGEAATGNRIQNNRIGTDVHGNPWGWMPNYAGGVYIYGANGNRIEANEIAYNAGDGVNVYYGVGNTITRNRIWDNSDLGIDHYDDGVTLDIVPELYSAWSGGGTTFVQGQLATFLPFTPYQLEFFVNSDSDPSGYGEGMAYLGTSQVWTDENGVGYFQEPFTRAVPPGYCVSATATDPDGTTWEFSNCVVVEAASGPGRGSWSGQTAVGLPWVELLSRQLTAAAPTAECTLPLLTEDAFRPRSTMPGWAGNRPALDDLETNSFAEGREATAALRPLEFVPAAVLDLLWTPGTLLLE